MSGGAYEQGSGYKRTGERRKEKWEQGYTGGNEKERVFRPSPAATATRSTSPT